MTFCLTTSTSGSHKQKGSACLLNFLDSDNAIPMCAVPCRGAYRLFSTSQMHPATRSQPQAFASPEQTNSCDLGESCTGHIPSCTHHHALSTHHRFRNRSSGRTVDSSSIAESAAYHTHSIHHGSSSSKTQGSTRHSHCEHHHYAGNIRTRTLWGLGLSLFDLSCLCLFACLFVSMSVSLYMCIWMRLARAGVVTTGTRGEVWRAVALQVRSLSRTIVEKPVWQRSDEPGSFAGQGPSASTQCLCAATPGAGARAGVFESGAQPAHDVSPLAPGESTAGSSANFQAGARSL